MKSIGILGGTFDPIHQGHVQIALEAKRQLTLDEVRLVPCRLPPHRDLPHLTGDQRLHLLRITVADFVGLLVEDCELKREGPSYTIDTLKALRKELGSDVSLVLIMGADAYCNLASWHCWSKLTVLANIAVMRRPGYELPKQGTLADWLHNSTPDQVTQQPAGVVVVLDQTQTDVSATQVRQQLADGQVPDYLLPPVRDYILDHQLYGFTKKQIL